MCAAWYEKESEARFYGNEVLCINSAKKLHDPSFIFAKILTKNKKNWLSNCHLLTHPNPLHCEGGCQVWWPYLLYYWKYQKFNAMLTYYRWNFEFKLPVILSVFIKLQTTLHIRCIRLLMINPYTRVKKHFPPFPNSRSLVQGPKFPLSHGY